jgi:hypothetical protein
MKRGRYGWKGSDRFNGFGGGMVWYVGIVWYGMVMVWMGLDRFWVMD